MITSLDNGFILKVNEQGQPLLQVKGLKKHFPVSSGFLSKITGYVYAVDGVSFDLHEGKCLGLVGESGSGKTTCQVSFFGVAGIEGF